MKKNLLVSAILLASATAQLSAQEIASVHTQITDTIDARGKLVFLASETHTNAKGTFRTRLVLVPAIGGHIISENNAGGWLASPMGESYEIIVQYIDVATGEVRTDSQLRYATYAGDGVFRARPCTLSSSKVVDCYDQQQAHVAIVGDVLTIPESATLKLEASDDSFALGSLSFIKIP